MCVGISDVVFMKAVFCVCVCVFVCVVCVCVCVCCTEATQGHAGETTACHENYERVNPQKSVCG